MFHVLCAGEYIFCCSLYLRCLGRNQEHFATCGFFLWLCCLLCHCLSIALVFLSLSFSCDLPFALWNATGAAGTLRFSLSLFLFLSLCSLCLFLSCSINSRNSLHRHERTLLLGLAIAVSCWATVESTYLTWESVCEGKVIWDCMYVSVY